MPRREKTNNLDFDQVQLLKMARGWKFWIWEVEGLYYPGSEIKGADQLRSGSYNNQFWIIKICYDKQ